MVCSAFSEERVCNSCATCISLHTISHGITQPSIHLRMVQEIRAQSVHLQKQESLSALCVWCNYRLVICRVTRGAHIESLWGRCVQNFESFSIDWCRCEVLSTPYLFSVSFLKCKVLLCSPLYKDRENRSIYIKEGHLRKHDFLIYVTYFNASSIIQTDFRNMSIITEMKGIFCETS
jgi:hypothetical protein